MISAERDALRRLGVQMTARGGDVASDADGWDHTLWRCTVRYQGRRMVVTYRMGMAHTDEPRLEDVIHSVITDGQCVDGRSFAEFCGDLGYDTDSRKAERTYQACIRQAASNRRVFGSALERVAAIVEEL